MTDDAYHIHYMSVEELSEFLCENPNVVSHNKDVQILVRNRITVLQQRIQRAGALFKALTDG
jgi:hypothetical protein